MHCISLVALFATLAASPVAAADLTSQVVRTRDAAVSDSTSLEVRRVRPKAVIVSNPQDVYWSAENESVFDYTFGPDDDTVRIGLDCLDCEVASTITATYDSDTVEDTTIVTLDLSNTWASLDLHAFAEANATYTKTLVATHFPVLGMDLDIVKYGLVVYFEIVLSVSAEIDLTGGITMNVPDGSYVKITEDGEIYDLNLDPTLEPLDWNVDHGAAVVSVALRLRADLGFAYDLIISDAVIGVGVFVNMPEIIADVAVSDQCPLDLEITIDLSAGAYTDADFDWVLFDPNQDEEDEEEMTAPAYDWSVVTTFLEGTMLSTCFGEPTSTTSQVVSGAPPITSSEPESTSFAVSGAPPVISSEPVATSVLVSGADPITLSPSTSASVSTITPFTTLQTFTAPHYVNTTSSELQTLTVSSTTVYTITSCAVQVLNCPATLQQVVVVTDVVDLFTTVCPVGETPAAPAPTPSSPSTTSRFTVTQGTQLTSCATPIVNTYTPPADVVPPPSRTTVVLHHTLTLTETLPPSSTSTIIPSEVISSISVDQSNSSMVPTTPASTADAPGRKSAAVIGSAAGLVAASFLML